MSYIIRSALSPSGNASPQVLVWARGRVRGFRLNTPVHIPPTFLRVLRAAKLRLIKQDGSCITRCYSVRKVKKEGRA